VTEFLVVFPDVFLHANMNLQCCSEPHSLFSPFPSNACNILFIFLKDWSDNSSILFLLTPLKLSHSTGAALLSQPYSLFQCEKNACFWELMCPLCFLLLFILIILFLSILTLYISIVSFPTLSAYLMLELKHFTCL